MKSSGDEKKQRVSELYLKGGTYREIGEQLNVTGARVEQIVKAMGIASPRAERIYATTFPARSDEVVIAFLRLRDEALVSKETGLSKALVRKFIDREVPYPAVLRSKERAKFEQYSDAENISCLRTAAEDLESPMSHVRYSEWASKRHLSDGRRWPGPQGMMIRYGTWRKALQLARLPINPPGGPSPQFDLRASIDAIVHAWLDGESPPTVASYEQWHVRHKAHPSSATIRKQFDGWNDALLAAWPIVTGIDLPNVAGQSEAQDSDENDATIARFGELPVDPEIDGEDAPEGRRLTRIHRVRERNGNLIRKKKSSVLALTGKLECEGCGFDFESTYGNRGEGFIECHHLIPISQLEEGARTKLEDLALLCSNCHRIVHRKAPWLALNELAELTQD